MPLPCETSISDLNPIEVEMSDWKKHVEKFCDLWRENATDENIETVVGADFVADIIGPYDHRLLESLKSMDDIVDVLEKREAFDQKNLSVLKKMANMAHVVDSNEPKWLQRAANVIERYENEMEENEMEKVPLCTCGKHHLDDTFFKSRVPYEDVALNIPIEDELDGKLLRLVFQRISQLDWKEVVRNLKGLKEGHILQARLPYHFKDPEMEYLNCCRMWKRNCPQDASLVNFFKALSKCNILLDEIVQMK